MAKIDKMENEVSRDYVFLKKKIIIIDIDDENN